jgi:hypothetical protein
LRLKALPLLVVAVGLIGFFTLGPRAVAEPASFDWCLGCGELGTLDILLNIGLFAPFGAALALISNRRVLAIALAAAALSTLVELAQLYVVSGRDPSVSDIVANTLGGALGAVLVRLATVRAAVPPQQWQWIAWVTAFAAAGALLLGEWSLRPHVVRETVFVQWLPERARYAPFRGDLRRIWLESRQLVPGEVLPRETIADEFQDGRVTFCARIVPGAATGSTALIARLVRRSGEFVMLGQDGDDLVARYRANAARLRLRMLRLPDAIVAGRDSVIDVALQLERGVLTLHATGSHAQSARHVMNAGRAWVVFLPGDMAVGRAGFAIDILWVALMFAAVAFAAARGGGRRVRWAALLPLLVAAAWNVWLGAAAGTLGGHWLGRRPSRQAFAART